MQKALLHGSGSASALLIYDRTDGKTSANVRTIAAQIIAAAESGLLPENVHILVALGRAALDDYTPFAEVPERENAADALSSSAQFPVTSHDLLVQVAANCEADRVLALRLVDAFVGANLLLRLEIAGGKILNNQEHFGFPDGNPPTGKDLARALHAETAARLPLDASMSEAIDQLRPLRRGAWLYFLQIKQNLDAFMELGESARADVVGRVPAHVSSSPLRAALAARVENGAMPPDSHWSTMRRNGKPALLRRGFPCRFRQQSGSAFGLAFLAACETPVAFVSTFNAMRGLGGAPDRLMPYIVGIDGGTYFCPPDASWLDPTFQQPPVPASVATLQHAVSLTSYEVAESFLRYIGTLRAAGFFEGPVGSMKPAGDIQPHLDAIYRALAQRSEFTDQELRDTQQQAEADANEVNSAVGEYLTIS